MLSEGHIQGQTDPEEAEEDEEYPGTAVRRMKNAQARALSLTFEQLNGDWETIRKNLLWAGGLKDSDVLRGKGYTKHCFNDFNHCDLICMQESIQNNDNEGRVPGISFNNKLGPGIEIASDPSLGCGGSWSTCMIGCHHKPPKVKFALFPRIERRAHDPGRDSNLSPQPKLHTIRPSILTYLHMSSGKIKTVSQII